MLDDDVLPALPAFPSPPLGMGRREWRQWAREQRRLARVTRDTVVPKPNGPGAVETELMRVETRILRFRRRIVQTLVLIPTLFAINVALRGFPWFIFPSAYLTLSILMRAGNLWADGISPV